MVTEDDRGSLFTAEFLRMVGEAGVESEKLLGALPGSHDLLRGGVVADSHLSQRT